MNRIRSKVTSARRRIVLGIFGRALCVSLFVGMLAAILAVAVPAIWPLGVDYDRWMVTWVGGAVSAAVLSAAIFAWWAAPSTDAVATEVDRRFGLRERLSSALGLADRDRDTEFGLALVDDADRRAEQLSIADRFSFRPGKLGLLPVALVPVLAVVLLLAEPAVRSDAGGPASAADSAEVVQVRKAAEELKKRIRQQRRKAEAKGLEEAKGMFEKMETELEEMTRRKEVGKKEAMITMNELKERLEKRRQELSSPDQMRRAMAQMKGLNAGPAEKVAKAMENGDFGKASEQVQKLADKLRDGKLSEKEKAELRKQVEQMRKQLQKAIREHEQKKEELRKKIEQARREGRSNDAAKLQQKLDELERKDSQMQRTGQMCESMSQAAQAMQQGDGSEAAEALESMSAQLGEMRQQMSELEDLESTLGDLSQSKNQMRCSSCQGDGCQQCQGRGQGEFDRLSQGGGQGDGIGTASGYGLADDPEDGLDSNAYDSQVRGKVQRGKAIVAGQADGPNRKGVTREDVKNAVQAALSDDSDALESQSLPRAEREHAQQYFDRLREGS